jgi:hypothetical protein
MESQDNAEKTQEAPQVNTEAPTDNQEQKTETYTREDVDKEISKVQSTFEKKWRDADSKAQKAQAALDEANNKYTALEDKITALERERERAMFNGIEDLPQAEKLKSLYAQVDKERDDIRDRQRELQKVQGEAAEGLKFRDATKLTKEIKEQYPNVLIDPEDLMDCKTYAEMQVKAKDLVLESYKTPKASGKEKIIPDKVDSGNQTPSSVGRIWKASEIENMSPEERFKMRGEIRKAGEEGRIDATR